MRQGDPLTTVGAVALSYQSQRKGKIMYRYIVYLQQNIPGNPSFTLERAESLLEAKRMFEEFRDAVRYDDCSAILYAYSDDRWAEAEEFDGIGCPLDYPDRIIESGPRGGIVAVNT